MMANRKLLYESGIKGKNKNKQPRKQRENVKSQTEGGWGSKPQSCKISVVLLTSDTHFHLRDSLDA